jgi:hypothetical protein
LLERRSTGAGSADELGAAFLPVSAARLQRDI